jgi:hypothetical protein
LIDSEEGSPRKRGEERNDDTAQDHPTNRGHLKSRSLSAALVEYSSYVSAYAFIISSGQVVYAFLSHHETLPPSYERFISNFSGVPDVILNSKRAILKNGSLGEDCFKQVTDYAKGGCGSITSPSAVHLPCSYTHPNISHIEQSIRTFIHVTKFSFPVYLSLNIIPAVAFRFGKNNKPVDFALSPT